ncbi:MAG: hypothetical protein KDK34_08390 [Leptospiraceae bacterium]|nr:hypothetical protein [Leptospiraceae bacterium]
MRLIPLAEQKPGSEYPDAVRELLRSRNTKLRDAEETRELHQKERSEYAPWLVCARCAEPITMPENACSVDGRHRHICTNPQGITFEIGCFTQAPGVQTVGPEIIEHTWFAHYAWRIALCSRCHTHLGWCYTQERSADTDTLTKFAGLILNRLRAGNMPGSFS